MNILFLCVGNSARSQIAEGLAREMLPSNFIVESAGSSPAGYIHEEAIATMKEIGIDISNQRSKSFEDLHDDFKNNIDFVITLCAEEICPIIKNNAKRIHWPNPNPAVQNMSSKHKKILFRETRENIFIMLKKFFTDLDT